MDTPRHGPEGDLNDLERRIARWRPAPGGLDRDRLMYEAGRASARPGRWERLGSASLACLALALGVLLVQERAHRRAGEAVPAPAPVVSAQVPVASPRLPSSPPLSPDPDSYLVLTHRMLAAAAEGVRAPAADSPFRPGSSAGHPEPPLSPLRARAPGGSLDL